jgi:nicotinate-nucleotide adenylyltransferase
MKNKGRRKILQHSVFNLNNFIGKEIHLKLGILGGTFDPIHLGHLRVAEEITEKLNLERLFLIPSAVPPHKETKPVTPFEHRLAMTQLAARESHKFKALDLEGRRHGFSYSVETLKELQQTFGPDPVLYFIIGMDAFLEIKTWKEHERLFYYAHFVVITRPGSPSRELGPFLSSLDIGFTSSNEKGTFLHPSGNKVLCEETTHMDISSTQIRERIVKGKSIRFLVLESVRSYIHEKELYKTHAGS